MNNKHVTICACTSRAFIHRDTVTTLASTLQNAGYDVAVVADLCKEAMSASAHMTHVAGGIIIACHQRTISSQLDRLGLAPVRMENIRQGSAEEVLSHLGLSYSPADDAEDKERWNKVVEAMPVEQGTDAWYPVLDKERCIECGKCNDFCLFGVYAIEDRHVRVVQPQNCKNNCPACARMCPQRAIIFPKYDKSPINGGTAEEETFSSEEMNKMYRERLQIRLQQRRASVSLLKSDEK